MQPDFDEFNYLERKKSPLDWRNPQPSCASDCKVIVNGGAKEYSIHLEVAHCSSKFFFDVASGRTRSAEKTPVNVPSTSGSDIQLKTQDGTTMKIGRATSTLSDFKEQVCKALGTSEQRQRLFYRKSCCWGPRR